ncbi:MAG: 50S ribosomal protein L32e [Candidatus Pacearchaeota archaeon]|nr:50S ribosomal protein L32e [Candidatus Pacearchaeota archaeon]
MKRKKPEFVRKDTYKISRLGRKRKKKRKWRRPRGRHSKVREKRKSYPKQPSIGYSKGKKESIKRVHNVEELENCSEGEKIIIAHVGKKKREEIIKKAKEKNIIVINEK